MSDDLSNVFENLSIKQPMPEPSSSTLCASLSEPNNQSNPGRKAKQVLYIAVELNLEEMNTIISSKLPPELVNGKTLKDEFHSTLEFKPSDISKFPENGTKCSVTIQGFGSSANAIAFKVFEIVTEEGYKVFHVLKEDGIPHITVALAPGIKPSDSYLSIRDGFYTEFIEPITVIGNIKYYYPEYKPKNR